MPNEPTLHQIRLYMLSHMAKCTTATELAEDAIAAFPDYGNEEAIFEAAQEIFYGD